MTDHKPDRRRATEPWCFSDVALAGMGVWLISQRDLVLQCHSCNERWQINTGYGRRLPQQYWLCPKGCNAA